MGACSNNVRLSAAALLAALLATAATVCSAQQLRRNYYASVCPNVESIVRDVVARKYRETFITVGATVHLFFHDCFVEGCDTSVVVASTPNSTVEKELESIKAGSFLFMTSMESIVLSAAYAQLNTTFVQQGGVMDMQVMSLTVPAMSMVSFEVLCVLAWLLIYGSVRVT